MKKEDRDKRREKRVKKDRWLKEQDVTDANKLSSKRPHSEITSGGNDEEDDWDELAKEERMAKKLRKGEISQRDFDVAFTDL